MRKMTERKTLLSSAVSMDPTASLSPKLWQITQYDGKCCVQSSVQWTHGGQWQDLCRPLPVAPERHFAPPCGPSWPAGLRAAGKSSGWGGPARMGPVARGRTGVCARNGGGGEGRPHVRHMQVGPEIPKITTLRIKNFVPPNLTGAAHL